MGKIFVHLYETRTRSPRARASRARLPQNKKQHILQCDARHLNGERRAIASFSLLLPPFSQDDKISLLLPPTGSKCAWPHQTLGSPYQPQLGQPSIRDFRHSVCFPFCGSPAPDSLPAPLFARRKRAASASRSFSPALHSLYCLSRRKRAHARHSGRCYGHSSFGFSPEGLVFRLSCGHTYRSLHACMHDTTRA